MSTPQCHFVGARVRGKGKSPSQKRDTKQGSNCGLRTHVLVNNGLKAKFRLYFEAPPWGYIYDERVRPAMAKALIYIRTIKAFALAGRTASFP